MGNIINLNELIELIQDKARRENRPTGDVIKEITKKLKEGEKN